MASGPAVRTSDHSGFFDSQADGGPDQRANGGWGSGRMLEENTAEQENGGKTEDITAVHALTPSSLHDTANILSGVNFDYPMFSGSSSSTLPWPDETLPSFHINNAGEASSLQTYDPKYSWASRTYQAQPMAIPMPIASPPSNDEQSRDVTVNPYGTPLQTYSTNSRIPKASKEVMDLDLPSGSAHIAPLSPTKASDVRSSRFEDKDQENARVSASFGMSSTAKFALSRDVARKENRINFDEEAPSIDEIQQRRMQTLSELAMDLYAQLAANDPKNHRPTSGATAAAFQDQLVGSVLKSSNTFLTLLTSFSAPATPSSPPIPPSPPPPSINQSSSTYSFSDSGTSPTALTPDHDDPALDVPVQTPCRQIPAGSSDDFKSPPPTDFTTVLQLLICYMRITHLHSIMHACILNYMLATTQHVDTVPPVFPGMQVGGVSLDKFGMFQINLLLQISMHVLGEIETALGLPEEYRVGTRKGGGRGVLEASVSGEFVKCVMREEAWRGERLKCMRERLGDLRRVLKGAIDF